MAFMLGKNLDFIDSIHFMNTSLKNWSENFKKLLQFYGKQLELVKQEK